MPETPAILMLSTCDTSEEADRIANTLVRERLAGCVNIVPGLTSVYRWRENVEKAAEFLLLIKTTPEQVPALEARLTAIHSYDTPEILWLRLDGGSGRYLEWLAAQVGPLAS